MKSKILSSMKTTDLNIYYEIYKLEDIQIQSNLNGRFEKRIKINKLEELENIKHNHRKIGMNEVIFDIDCHIPEIYNPVWDRISTRLQNDNISHQCWFTSRSPHIHCFFQKLNLYSFEIRRLIKLSILKEYAQEDFKWIDKSLISENRMIRDFGSEHEITHRKNALIYEFHPETLLNPLPSKILNKTIVCYTQQEKVPEISYIKPTEPFLKELERFVSYCCENTLRGDGKERYLFRNIAIACLLLNYNYNQKIRIYYTTIQNCATKRHINELIAWDKFLQKQSKLWFNWKEIEQWYRQEEKDSELKER